MKNFQSCRLVVAGFAVLACTAAQSPCGGNPRDVTAGVAATRQNGLGVASVIPFTGVAPSVVGDPTLAYAEWKQGVGCPTNVADPYTCFASSDPADLLNTGLFLVKTGPTTSDPVVDLSLYPLGVEDLSPYPAADLQGVAGANVSDLFELGYDLRNTAIGLFAGAGSHCGLRSPRFNVVTQGAAGTSTHRFYCFNGAVDNVNLGWVRLRWTMDQADPPMDPSDTIQSIKIVADEGQDPVGGIPDLFAVAVLDNIDVNGVLVGAGLPPPPPPGGGDDEDDGQGEDHDHNCFHFNGNWTHGEKSRLSYSDKPFRSDGDRPVLDHHHRAGGLPLRADLFAVQGQAEGSRLAQEGIPPRAAARSACERGRAAAFQAQVKWCAGHPSPHSKPANDRHRRVSRQSRTPAWRAVCGHRTSELRPIPTRLTRDPPECLLRAAQTASVRRGSCTSWRSPRASWKA